MAYIAPQTIQARVSGKRQRSTLPGPYEVLLLDGQSLAGSSGATAEEENLANMMDRNGIGMMGGLKTSAGLAVNIAGPFGVAYNYTIPTTGLTTGYSKSNTPLCFYVAAALRKRREMEARANPTLVTTFNGIPGQAIDEFDDNPATGGGAGTTIHANRGFWMQQVKNTLGSQVTGRWAGMAQGEADANRNEGLYYASAMTVWLQWMGQAESILGQRPVPFATQIGSYVNSDPGTKQYHVCLEQIRAVQDSGGYFVAPWYAVPVDDNNVHPWTYGIMLMADTIAWALVEIESGRGWPALVPTVVRDGGDLVLTYPCRPDETMTLGDPSKYAAYGGAPAAQGFEVGDTFNARGVIQNTGAISQVSAQGRTVRLTTPKASWAYAMQFGDMTEFASAGRNYGPHRGLVRSTLSTPSVMIPGEILYRWAPSWRGTVA